MNTMPIEIPRGTYFTIADAASESGVTPGRVRQLIRDGGIACIQLSERSYLIPSREVRKLKKPSKVGRPRSNATEKISQ